MLKEILVQKLSITDIDALTISRFLIEDSDNAEVADIEKQGSTVQI